VARLNCGLLSFEWDDVKAVRNMRKHGVSFEEAATIFLDPLALVLRNDVEDAPEERFILIGLSLDRRTLTVVGTSRGEETRIISARRSTRKERRRYEKERS